MKITIHISKRELFADLWDSYNLIAFIRLTREINFIAEKTTVIIPEHLLEKLTKEQIERLLSFNE